MRHLDILWIEFDSDEAAAQTEGHHACRTAAAERIEHGTGHRVLTVGAGGLPTHGFRGRERVIVVPARLTPSADTCQHPPATGLRIGGAPLSAVAVDHFDWGFRYHSLPRRPAQG